MVCLETLTWVVYPVSVPCHVDHSYTVEVYTSWILRRMKHARLAPTHVACATACRFRKGGNFTDSKSFILAIRSRLLEELGAGLVDLLLADCMAHATHFTPPQHLYCHQDCIVLDLVLDDVHREAKAQALRQPHPMPAGYPAVPQTPQPAFCRDGVQWHDVSTTDSRQLQRLYATQQEVEKGPEVALGIIESHGAPWGYTSTGEKDPSSLMERCFAHVQHYPSPSAEKRGGMHPTRSHARGV